MNSVATQQPTDALVAAYSHLADLSQSVDIPSDGTLSRTIYSDASIKVVIFGFDTGQELSEHTSSRPALLQVVKGEARLTLGPDTLDVSPGSWVHMTAGLAHSVSAKTPLILLLTLLPHTTGSDETTA